MPTWIGNMPKDNGASDLEDSARLAGILVAAGQPPFPPAERYLSEHGNLVRWKFSTLPFTRDQLIPLAYFYSRDRVANSVLEGKLTEAASRFTAPNGKDFLAPHHRSHLQACLGGSWSLIGKTCLVAEIYWHTYHEGGVSEPNQLICMLLTAGPKYVRMWKKANPLWMTSIRAYWCGWRNEPELAERLINALTIY